MTKIEAGNAVNSKGAACKAIRKFSKASAPALAPHRRPAGDDEIGYLALKLISHVLIRGSLTKYSNKTITGDL